MSKMAKKVDSSVWAPSFRWEKIGTILNDSGMVMIVDPTHLINWKNNSHAQASLATAREATANGVRASAEMIDQKKKSNDLSYAGAVTVSKEGGTLLSSEGVQLAAVCHSSREGKHNVYIKKEKDGQISEMRVRFNETT